ncbi:hypothetical protein DL93DRAFT_2080983 [Clavulina sp. PMI_390]|nr:hypothetical protein DL93DRAFT_2080983 [Clavulina sp. PMI_390]
MSTPATPRKRDSSADGVFQRSIHALSDLFSPFSSSALASLPPNLTSSRNRSHATRADNIPDDPEVDPLLGPSTSSDYQYQSIGQSLPPGVKIPKKISTPIKVEPKVWFANERTWLSYLSLAILLGSLAVGLFNASTDAVAQNFAMFYGAVSLFIVVYGYAVYQQRITMIRKRYGGNFDQLLGPIIISVLLFVAVLSNFIIRYRELKRGSVPHTGN